MVTKGHHTRIPMKKGFETLIKLIKRSNQKFKTLDNRNSYENSNRLTNNAGQ